MNCTLRLSVLALACNATLANASAQQPVQSCASDTLAVAPTNWVRNVTLPKFDPALGALQSVGVTLQANIHGSAKEESFDTGPTQVSVRFECAVVLQRPNASDLLLTRPTVDFLDSLGAFDGSLDYAGASGVTHRGIDAAQSASLQALPNSADFALFTGAEGNPGTLVLPMTAIGMSVANGGGNLHTQFVQSAGATVTVCYTYVPSLPPYFEVCAQSVLASVGVPISFEVCASAASATDSVTLSAVDLPIGASSMPMNAAFGSSACSLFSWTPSLAQVGPTAVTFVATDSHQRTSTCTATIVTAECHMLFSFGGGNAQQVLFGRLYDTQLVGLRRAFPVTMDHIPSFPFQYLPANCFVQVVAFNPYSFPTNASQWSQALHVIKDRVHERVTDEYLGTMNGIGIRAELYEVNGQKRVRFPFRVLGL